MTTFSTPKERLRPEIPRPTHTRSSFHVPQHVIHLNHSLTALRARTRPAKQGPRRFAHLLLAWHTLKGRLQSPNCSILPHRAQCLHSAHLRLPNSDDRTFGPKRERYLQTTMYPFGHLHQTVPLERHVGTNQPFLKLAPQAATRYCVLRIFHTPSRKSLLPSHRQSHVSERWASDQQTTANKY
jgi:hypothetical protein